MNQSFRSICEKDIIEVLSMFEKYLPNLEKWYFNQSIIYEDNKKIICRSIKDNENYKIGNEIRIHVIENKSIYYFLRYKDKSIYFLEKEGSNTKMIYVALNDILVKRQIEITNKQEKNSYKEEYCVLNNKDLEKYNNSKSLEELINSLKPKQKVRKRN